jgi:SAM-dependent methyltransferase
MNQKELRRYLNVIKRAVSLIEGMLENDDGGLLEQFTSDMHITQAHAHHASLPQPVMDNISQQAVPAVQPPIAASVPNPEELEAHLAARKKHIDSLMQIDCWPEAVPQFLVAKDASSEDQINRANAVLDMMLDRPVEDCNFLDFGCGDGWIAKQIIERGTAESFGYDIKQSENWANLSGANFTSNFNDLKKSFYDVIILYDVLDHCEDPVLLMNQIRSLVKQDGVVYIRCHPWVSKHATHLYKQGVNKAYMHLFLTYPEILELIQQEPMFTRVEKNPLEAYHWWFKDFEIKKERFVREPVSEFFHVPSFKELLAKEQEVPMEYIDEFMKGLEIQFIDYCLVPKKS